MSNAIGVETRRESASIREGRTGIAESVFVF